MFNAFNGALSARRNERTIQSKPLIHSPRENLSRYSSRFAKRVRSKSVVNRRWESTTPTRQVHNQITSCRAIAVNLSTLKPTFFQRKIVWSLYIVSDCTTVEDQLSQTEPITYDVTSHYRVFSIRFIFFVGRHHPSITVVLIFKPSKDPRLLSWVLPPNSVIRVGRGVEMAVSKGETFSSGAVLKAIGAWNRWWKRQ